MRKRRISGREFNNRIVDKNFLFDPGIVGLSDAN